MGETADVAGAGRERQLQRGRVDAHAEPGAAPGVRGEHAVHAVQPELGRTVPGRLGEPAVHQGVVHAAAAGQDLSATVVRVVLASCSRPRAALREQYPAHTCLPYSNNYCSPHYIS